MEKDGETLKAHGLHLRPECDLVRKVRDNDFAFALKVLPQILLGRSTVPFLPRNRTILCLFYNATRPAKPTIMIMQFYFLQIDQDKTHPL